MKYFCIGLMLAMSSQAADLVERPHTPKRVWIRRITLVAACAASVGFDTMSTRRAVSAGAVETNPLLADPNGKPQWGRMIGIKAGVCGASAFLQERHSSARSDWAWTAGNAATAAAYTWTGFHNLHVANELSGKH
jgi:hypothetical protein